jgi:predicted nucleic acid-binding protein
MPLDEDLRFRRARRRRLALLRQRVDARTDRSPCRGCRQAFGLPGVHANLVPHAHLATLAIEHGLTLCSTDGDFTRFHGLRWHNPLAA